MLNHVKYPLKVLEGILNAIIDQVNRQNPVKGAGIAIDKQSPNGTVISVEVKSPDSSVPDPAASSSHAPPGDSAGGTWMTIDVMDASCHRSTIQVWAKTL